MAQKVLELPNEQFKIPNMSDYEILMGACGWQYDQWDTQYYPEDLPAEWRLAYYGNEFPVVLIPESYWHDSTQSVADWIEESEERPVFIAELPSRRLLQGQDLSVDQWLEQLAPLRSRLIGISCPVDDANALPDLLEPLPPDIPLCVEPRTPLSDEDLGALVAQAPRSVGCCWHGQGDASCMHAGPLSIARVDSRQITARELRAVVETCLSAAGEGRRVALLVDGDPPDLETLRNAEVILDLL